MTWLARKLCDAALQQTVEAPASTPWQAEGWQPRLEGENASAKQTPAFRRLCSVVEHEDDLFAIAGGERDAGALVEIIDVECLAGLKARSTGLKRSLFYLKGGDACLERAFLCLQVHVRDQALTARHGVRAEIKDRCA